MEINFSVENLRQNFGDYRRFDVITPRKEIREFMYLIRLITQHIHPFQKLWAAGKHLVPKATVYAEKNSASYLATIRIATKTSYTAGSSTELVERRKEIDVRLRPNYWKLQTRFYIDERTKRGKSRQRPSILDGLLNHNIKILIRTDVAELMIWNFLANIF